MAQRECLTTEKACNLIAKSVDISAYQSLFSNVNFYTGIDNENKEGPCVICAATEALPEPPDCPSIGNYVVKTSIIVKDRPTKTAMTTTLADSIFKGFLTASVEQTLTNNATNFFVHHVWVDNQLSNVEGKFWVETLNLNIMCCST